MAQKIPDLSEVKALQAWLELEDLDLKLFKNNHVPADTDTAADYTEANFTGYAAEPLVMGSWVYTPGSPSTAVYGDVVYTSSAGSQSQIVYGYYVVQRISGDLMFAERFDDNDPEAPYTIVNVGDTITVPLATTGRDTTE